MSDDELLHFFHLGFVPFEGENEEDFKKRAAYGLDIESHLTRHLGQKLPPRDPFVKLGPRSDRIALPHSPLLGAADCHE